jgi:FkbM family methyltransferase
MGFVRSRAVKSVKWILARQGYAVVTPMLRFGFDPFTDIRRLAGLWGYPIHLIFDVGANVGDTAVEALSKFPEARVVSFEPHPATFAKLSARMTGNARHRSVNVAFGLEAGEAEMFVYDESKVNSLTPDAQFAKRHAMEGHSIRVKTTTMDRFCAENGIESVDVLKIDTEGFDLVVLEGCRSMMERGAVKFIYVEFNDLQPTEGVFGGALLPFDELLRPYGYRFVASYNDYIETSGEMFSVSNALFALPPGGGA